MFGRRKRPMNRPVKPESYVPPTLPEYGHRPRTRRDFLSCGLAAGVGSVLMPTAGGVLLPWRTVLAATLAECGDTGAAAGIARPMGFICIDCAGGSNFIGSNIMVGGPGGQMDQAGIDYSALGLPGNMAEDVVSINGADGLMFQADSAILRGITGSTSDTTRANMDGAVFPCASNDDSGNNQLNPAYAIAQAGAKGQLTALVGTRNSDSGGKSQAIKVDASLRPSVISRSSDATGLVDTGGLGGANFVADAIQQISAMKLNRIQEEKAMEDIIHCASLLSAKATEDFANPALLDPAQDQMVNAAFPDLGNQTLDRAAGIAKLVIDGFAGAGTVEIGGADYHNGSRARGEAKDEEIGQAIGGIMELAALKQTPIMVFVISDGSVFSNGNTDDSGGGRGKGTWNGDDGSKGAGFFLVYNPVAAPAMRAANSRQVGFVNSGASVSADGSPVAGNPATLAEAAVMNYMSMNAGEAGLSSFNQMFSGSAISGAAMTNAHAVFQGLNA
ncbi:MAG: general secretion pathway protein GspF [Gammaproteobacteria bacterium]